MLCLISFCDSGAVYEQKSTYMIVERSVKHTDKKICLWPLTDV